MQILKIFKLKSLILSNQLKTSLADERPGERSRIRQEVEQLCLLAVRDEHRRPLRHGSAPPASSLSFRFLLLVTMFEGVEK